MLIRWTAAKSVEHETRRLENSRMHESVAARMGAQAAKSSKQKRDEMTERHRNEACFVLWANYFLRRRLLS